MSPYVTAILEITAMLLVAFALGIGMVWYPMKRKLSALNEQFNHFKHEFNSLEEVLEEERKSHQRHRQEKEAEIKETQAEIKLLKKRGEEMKKSHEQSQEKLVKEKQELNQQFNILKLKLQQSESARQKEKELAGYTLKKVEDEREILGEKLKGAKGKKRVHAYYRIIGDKKYDHAVLTAAEKAVAGQGDGRISQEDAEELFALIADSNRYTDIEKASIKYIRDNFIWTEEADQYFRQKVRQWAAERAHSEE